MVTISKGNTKLGKLTNWSLPRVETCPSRTSLCEAICYVEKSARQYPSVRNGYANNLDSVLMDGTWKVELLRHLSKYKPSMFRIHVSGDFFAPSYIKAWGEIIALNPETRFVAYTRSWRNARLRKELNLLRKNLSNLVLFASCDAEAHNAPEGWKKAWMGEPLQGKAMKCLEMVDGSNKNCDTCGICWKENAPNVYFPLH